jgi:hypothetical protein
MSIRVEITTRLAEGRLFLLSPAMRSEPVVRCVFLSKEINDLVHGPWENKDAAEVFGKFRADLDSFLAGRVISVAKNPRKAKTAFLNRLENERGKVWEMRQRRPKPGIRILGGFAEKDIFIGLTWSPRAPLLGYGSRNWRDAIEESKVSWRNLFLTWPPMGDQKADHNDYVSNILPV